MQINLNIYNFMYNFQLYQNYLKIKKLTKNPGRVYTRHLVGGPVPQVLRVRVAGEPDHLQHVHVLRGVRVGAGEEGPQRHLHLRRRGADPCGGGGGCGGRTQTRPGCF